jgi:hypothetical protein
MGILDDAIKEHLELKRQHGAGADELRKLEDEAFGAAERPGEPGSAPDAPAEAPTEFMAQPEAAEPAEAGEPAEGRRPRPDVADLQEPPPPPEPERQSPAEEPQPEEPPAEEEAPAIEQAIPEPPAASEPEPPAGPSTEEREAIAEQPTEMYDVDEELGGSEAPAPSEDELVEEEIQEPRLAPVDPLSGVTGAEEEGEDSEQETDDFFDEQRLSDELDQALEGPAPAEPEDEEDAELAEEGPEDEEGPAEPQEEDVLEETPEFLDEDEDDQLWFEQQPPKDFDFDD